MTEPDNILFLETVDSTNRYAVDHFDELPDGTLVVAGEQTAGRGRLGRKWLSPPGENLYVSCVLKQLRDPFLATAAGSLASLRMMREAASGIDFYLKWPNDIYCGSSKICGVLSEAVMDSRTHALSGVVAGLGINVNSTAETLSGAGDAASLKILTGQSFSVKKLVFSLAKCFRACYITYLNASDELFLEWKTENRLIGRELEFVLPDGRVIRSRFLDITPDGSAVILDGSERKVFSCGDVRIVKKTWMTNN